ncbi:hypothetical protein RV02_GL001275 [Enterococcus gilvus]|nr:hypothetical protein RV02_GL001275 [Enterococcus gilvus]
MSYFLIKIFIALGLISLAGIVLAILKSNNSEEDKEDKDDDDWKQF